MPRRISVRCRRAWAFGPSRGNRFQPGDHSGLRLKRLASGEKGIYIAPTERIAPGAAECRFRGFDAFAPYPLYVPALVPMNLRTRV